MAGGDEGMGGLKRGRWPSREPGGARWARSVPRRSQARRTMMSPPLLRARTLTVRSDCSGVPGACRWLRTRPVGVCASSRTAMPEDADLHVQTEGPLGVHVRRSRHRRPTQHPRHHGPITAHCSSDNSRPRPTNGNHARHDRRDLGDTPWPPGAVTPRALRCVLQDKASRGWRGCKTSVEKPTGIGLRPDGR
jgi:hypothetical protein